MHVSHQSNFAYYVPMYYIHTVHHLYLRMYIPYMLSIFREHAACTVYDVYTYVVHTYIPCTRCVSMPYVQPDILCNGYETLHGA